MLLTFTDAQTNNPIAVNPKNVVAVFTVVDGDMAGKTVVGVVNGNILVNESYIDVVGQIQGQQL